MYRSIGGWRAFSIRTADNARVGDGIYGLRIGIICCIALRWPVDVSLTRIGVAVELNTVLRSLINCAERLRGAGFIVAITQGILAIGAYN